MDREVRQELPGVRLLGWGLWAVRLCVPGRPGYNRIPRDLSVCEDVAALSYLRRMKMRFDQWSAGLARISRTCYFEI